MVKKNSKFVTSNLSEIFKEGGLSKKKKKSNLKNDPLNLFYK